jgi:putative transposase
MTEDSSIVRFRQPDEIDDPLTALLRSGARRLLEQAIEAEVEAFLASRKELKLTDGRDRLVRHGPERVIQTGTVEVQRIKVRDRGAGPPSERIRFSSALLPRWARRTTSSALSGLSARTPCCRSCTCAASRPVISRRR